MIRRDYSLAKFSWFKTGGKADFFCQPNDIDELKLMLLSNIRPVTVLGCGSNVLIRDGGVRGLVIRLGKNFSYIREHETGLKVGAATFSSSVAKFARDRSFNGFAFYTGIPGNIGGAIVMNAGCYGSETASVLLGAQVMFWNGSIATIEAKDLGYVYRGHTLGKKFIVLEGLFKIIPGKSSFISEQMRYILDKKNSTQPINQRTCGSVFKNPVGLKAWELIKKAGHAGISYKGCKFSELHSNFLINTGSNKAENLESLCEQVQQNVKIKTGVDLSWELKRIGERELCYSS